MSSERSERPVMRVLLMTDWMAGSGGAELYIDLGARRSAKRRVTRSGS